jgi:hypothetical protein
MFYKHRHWTPHFEAKIFLTFKKQLPIEHMARRNVLSNIKKRLIWMLQYRQQ